MVVVGIVDIAKKQDIQNYRKEQLEVELESRRPVRSDTWISARAKCQTEWPHCNSPWANILKIESINILEEVWFCSATANTLKLYWVCRLSICLHCNTLDPWVQSSRIPQKSIPRRKHTLRNWFHGGTDWPLGIVFMSIWGAGYSIVEISELLNNYRPIDDVFTWKKSVLGLSETSDREQLSY